MSHDTDTPHTDLRKWMLAQPAKAFPDARHRKYKTQYQNLEDYLNTNVHPEVEKLAMTVDGGYLTDHGPDHIATVIERASRLINSPKTRMSPYEAYVLLVAIHLHDVGNIYGRLKHEQRLAEVMGHIGTRLGNDGPELRMIREIASAHGGKDETGKNIDTIGGLEARTENLANDVRMQFLAAVLRFADELADDKARASRLALALGQLPQDARIYHEYANRLDSVNVRAHSKTIELRFSLDVPTACATFLKEGHQQYLLDEIYARTTKMHRERIYCSRFMRDAVTFDAIHVRVRVFRAPDQVAPLEQIEYTLVESGYPETPDIKSLVPNIPWTGQTLKDRLTPANGNSGHAA
jgi:hypothetical protein